MDLSGLPHAAVRQSVRDALEIMIALEQVWEDVGVGLVITEAFFSDHPNITADSIAARLPALSVDTVRRRLQRLVDRRLVIRTDLDNRHFYKAEPIAAETTLHIMNRFDWQYRKMQPDSACAR